MGVQMEEFEQPQVWRRKQVQTITGLSRSSITSFVKAATFPAPISIGPRAIGWLRSEINTWLAGRATQRTVPIVPRAKKDVSPIPKLAVLVEKPKALRDARAKVALLEIQRSTGKCFKRLPRPNSDPKAGLKTEWMTHDGVIEPLVSTRQVAHWIRLSKQVVHRLASEGYLPAIAFPFGSTGRYRYYFRVAEVEEHQNRMRNFNPATLKKTSDTSEEPQPPQG